MSSDKKPLSPADALKLLELLTTDHDFRREFQENPALALAKVSPEAAASAVECTMPGPLAEVDALVSAREQLLESITTNAVFSLPHCLINAGTDPAA